MKKALGLLALLLLAAQVYSQTQPVVYSTLSRTITSSTTNSFLTNQRLPACYQVDYLVSDITSISEGNLFSVLYVPRSDVDTPAPSAPVTIQFFTGTSSAPVTPLEISSVISDTVDTITYLSELGGCDISADGESVVRSSGGVGNGCGLNFYCSGFTSTVNTRLWVRIITSDEENQQGILFDLSVRRGGVTVSSLTVGTTSTFTAVPATGDEILKPTVAQRHYKVAVGPAGTSISQVADFLVRNNPSTQLRFTLSNLRVNGVAAPSGSSQGEWSLNINFGDLATADSTSLLSTDPAQPCMITRDVDTAFYQSSQVLEVIIPGCGVTQGTYYIDVASPLNSNSYTYDLLVVWEPINDNNYIQSYKTLTSGVYMNDVIGYYSQTDAKLQNVYLLNLSPSNFVTGSSYFFVTVFGVDFGSVSLEVTQGCFGYDSSCSSCDVVAQCNNWSYGSSPSPDDALDYCKVKVDACNADTTLPYFVTVRANPYSGYNYVEYSIQFDIRNTNPIEITSLSSVQGDGYIEYTYIGKVEEQDYNHFVYTVPTSSVTPNYHLTAQVYPNQEQDEIIFTHNGDSLAGSGSFISSYPSSFTYGPLEGSPFDDCYHFDFMCNTLYKDTRQYNAYDYNNPYISPIASCTAVLPYCDILSASKHYFSVYAVNSSPNSYWGEMYNYPGTGYARAVEYTLVFRLYTQAEELVPGEIITSYVVQENFGEFWTYSNDNADEEYLSNWYTHQYVVNMPTNPNQEYDNVRIVLGDAAQSSSFDFIRLYATCGAAAGECPCFSKADYSCSAFDGIDHEGYYEAGEKTCQVYIPLCDCEGPIYLSVRSFSSEYVFRPTSFTLGAFFDGTQSQTIALPANSASYNQRLMPNNNFDLVQFDEYSLRFYYLHLYDKYWWDDDNFRLFIYDTDLYVLPVASVNANRGLEFTVRYTTLPGTTERGQYAIVSVARDVVPPTNPFTSSCSTNCIAAPDANTGSTEGWSYCTITIDPCEVDSGNYYIRVSGVTKVEAYTYYFNYYNNYLNLLDFAGVSYTLTVTQTNQAAVALTLGTPIRDSLHVSEYKHYSLSVPNQSNTAMRVHLYRNADQGAALSLYLNDVGGFMAGNGPCYSYTHRCDIAFADDSSVCDFYIPICEFSSIAGKTIFLSVENQNVNANDTLDFSYYWRYSYLPSRISHFADIPIQYTIGAQLVSIISLDLNRGTVMTGNVHKQNTDYYSYTVSQSDINAGKSLTIEIANSQPYSYPVSLRTSISTTNPATQAGDCPCADYDNVYLNNVRLTMEPCELTAGTYYISVKALLDGFNTPFDPISYTVKAFFTTPVTQTLPLTTTWSVAPKPLNFRESVVYSIGVTASQNQVVQIEIADLRSTLNSLYANGINAYLNFGVPGSSSCNIDSCSAVNNENPDTVIPAGTVMCRFTITPCTDCSGTYYLTVEADMIAPEPRIQYLSNYTVRAYTTTINTLDTFPADYRTSSLVAGGFNFDIQNTVNPTIQCDTRWSTEVYQDFFFRLPAITINQYEQFMIDSLVSNPSNVVMSFSADVSPARSGACGCDAAPGASCLIDTGCTAGVQTVNVYARVGISSCSGFVSQNVNGLDFNTEILADRVYTQLTQQTVATNVPFTTTLAQGQFIVLRYSTASINFNLLPTLSFDIDLTGSGGSVLDRTCFVYGSGSSVAQTFPGSVSAGSSYCNLCTPMSSASLEFDGCCVDPSDVLLLTVYNPPNGPSSFSFTFTASVDNDAIIYDALSLPISRTYGSVRDDIATTFSFSLSSDSLRFDDVLNFRIASANGTAVADVNYLYFAHTNSDCASSFFSCSTDQQNCNFQFPACFFAGETNGIGYITYYIAIEATSDPFVGPVTISIAVQSTTVISVPSVTSSRVIPDVASTPADYMIHYKFQYPRSVGDMLLSGNNVAVQVQLTPGSTATNDLILSISDPRFSGSSNPLAGQVSGGNPVASVCNYNHDTNWECFASNNNLLSTRTTDGTVGVTCVLYFCNNGVPEPELAQLLSNQFVYVSVQNTDTSSERTPTPFTIGVSINSTSLPSSQVLYSVNPSATTTDRNFTSNCATGSAIDGGCNYVPSATVDTAYYSVNLANIGSWGVNDYLLVNFTNVVGSSISIALWGNDECEPDVSTTTLTCTPGQVCTLQGDPCEFTSLFRADNGANSYVTEARNMYIRVRGLTVSTSFNIAVLRVTPLQITVPLSASSPSYSATFQSWEGRWTMFNFILPKSEMYDFDVSITSDCGTASEPEVYLNEYSYQWASVSCSELDSNTPFSYSHYSCELGGNFFVSVYTPIGSLQYSPIIIPEGRVSPQVKFTVTASLTKVVTSYAKYSWESEVNVLADTNFEAIGDNENYGTGLSIRLSADSTVFLSVISPLYRESFEDDSIPVPVGDWNTAFYTANSFCNFPLCSDPGVYCCTDDSDCVINIPPCEYRNGRYFIFASSSSPAVLSSRIYRQDYITLAFSDTTDSLSVTGTLPLGLIEGDNLDLNYYQFYEITISGNPQFLHVQLKSNAAELFLNLFDYYGYYFAVDDYHYISDFISNAFNPFIRASLRRGDTGLSTTSILGDGCADVYCSTRVPGSCDFGEVNCVADTYYLGVWFENSDNQLYSDCDVLQYEVVVSVRDNDPITIFPDTTICGTVQGSPIDYTNPPQESDGSGIPVRRDYFYRNVDDDDNFAQYPTSITYMVDLTNVNTDTDDVTVTLRSIQSEFPEQLTLSISTTGPPSANCADCDSTTDSSEYVDAITRTILCGSYSELWITVSTTLAVDEYNLIFDYLLEVSFDRYSPVNPSIPTLTFGVPSTVSVTLTSENSVFAFSTNNHQRALIRPNGLYVAGTPNVNQQCLNGCPEVETGCTFLGAEDTYYVYFSASLDTDVECFETPVTSAVESIQVQSVRSWNIPSSGSSDISGVIPNGGFDLIYVTLPSASSNGFSLASLDFYMEVALETAIIVEASCDGFTVGTNCPNDLLFSFSDNTVGTYTYMDPTTCGCTALYLTVYQASPCGSGTDYTIGVQVNTIANPYPLAALTNNVYVAATLPAFTPGGSPYRYYSIAATTDNFVHVSINRANNTAGSNGHDVIGTLYDSNGCFIQSCSTGFYSEQTVPLRIDGNSQDSSCYLYTDNAVANQQYYVLVEPNEPIASPPASAATYRIKPIVNYVDLETTANQNFQLVGFDRQYYKVNGRVGGVASGTLQSVVITLNIIDGDRVAIVVADSPSYINLFESQSDYDGWARSKVCYFGQCTMEISTLAQHPGVPVFYVWVETVTTDAAGNNDYRVEKQVNYQISATTGLNNCESSSNFITGFCASTVQTLSNVYSYRDAGLRNQEAQARFNSFLCRCEPPSAACLSQLTRFSCLESFRECDSRGFWTPLCRNECELVEDSCGAFSASLDENCDCVRPEFACTNARYSDAGSGVCTGVQVEPTPSPSPSASPLPSGASASRTPTRSASLTPSPGSEPSTTSTASPAPEVSPSPEPSFDPSTQTSNDGSQDIIIKYYILYGSASSLVPSAFLIALSVLFFFF